MATPFSIRIFIFSSNSPNQLTGSENREDVETSKDESNDGMYEPSNYRVNFLCMCALF